MTDATVINNLIWGARDDAAELADASKRRCRQGCIGRCANAVRGVADTRY